MIDFKNDPLSSFLLCVGILVMVMDIYYHFVRWVFSINKRIENQERQIELLEKIAIKLGVTENTEENAPSP